MNYTEAVDYIEEIPKFTAKNPPEHTRELLRRLGDPQEGMRIIHVAGTNGKGSVCAYLASMFAAGGYRCGLFTSPHLVKINERYRIGREMVGDALFLEAFLAVKDVIDGYMAEGQVHPSYFETLFLMGMYIFKKEKVDYLVMETGLGGRLDATNVIEHPLACVITSISRDHTEYLGETIPEIAGEKAGIIKPGVPVIYDAHDREAAEVIRARAEQLGSPAYPLTEAMYRLEKNDREGIRFTFCKEAGKETGLQIASIAPYQMMNASLAYFTMRVLAEVHGIGEERLQSGIADAHWPCRMETVLPGVIIDGAHNEDGVARFVQTVRHFHKDHTITILFSAVSDKRYRAMICEICEGICPECVVTTSIWGDRAVPAKELAGLFTAAGCGRVLAEPDIGAAFERALQEKGDGMLFCVGSLYLAGELKAYLAMRDQAAGRTDARP